MENIKEKENLEDEILSLKSQLQHKYINKSYENNSKILEQIISNQNPFFDKTSIGYNQNIDEASSSKTTGNEEKPRSFTEVVKGSTNEDEIKCQPEQYIPKGRSAER